MRSKIQEENIFFISILYATFVLVIAFTSQFFAMIDKTLVTTVLYYISLSMYLIPLIYLVITDIFSKNKPVILNKLKLLKMNNKKLHNSIFELYYIYLPLMFFSIGLYVYEVITLDVMGLIMCLVGFLIYTFNIN